MTAETPVHGPPAPHIDAVLVHHHRMRTGATLLEARRALAARSTWPTDQPLPPMTIVARRRARRRAPTTTDPETIPDHTGRRAAAVAERCDIGMSTALDWMLHHAAARPDVVEMTERLP